MRPISASFAFVAALSTLFAVGCAATAADDSANASSNETAAPTGGDGSDRPHTFWCLVPEGHPATATAEVWVADITSGFGPPITKEIRRTTGFYFHGTLLNVADASSATWTISKTDETDGTVFFGQGDQGSIEIDVTGNPSAETAVSGTVKTFPTNGVPEEIKLIGGRVCPTAN